MSRTTIEDYYVFIDGDRIKAKGVISGSIFCEKSKEEASEVIQTAVDMAASDGGSTIRIMCGVFPLSKTIRLQKGVSFKGSGRASILKVLPENKEGMALYASQVDGLRISELTVDGDKYNNPHSVAGIVLENCGDAEVSNVYAVRFNSYGIWMKNQCFLSKLLFCNAADNTDTNIFLDFNKGGSRVGFCVNMVNGCVCYGGGHGIRCHSTSVLNITNCEVYRAKKHGFVLEGWGTNREDSEEIIQHTTYSEDNDNFFKEKITQKDRPSFSTSILISGCRTFQIGECALVVKNSHELNASSNIFCWTRGDGIVLDNVLWGTVNGNEIIDSGVRNDPPRIGVWLTGGTKLVHVTGNAIFNWPEQTPMIFGVKEDEGCYKNMIANNIINYYTEKAVLSKGEDTLVKDNLKDHRSFAALRPYDGKINDFYMTWRSMGPYEKNQFHSKLNHFKMDNLDKFIREL